MLPKVNSKFDMTVTGNDKIVASDICLEVIHTPGHTKGCMCLYLKEANILFTGDTLFADCYGRTDLQTGNFEDMKSSLDYLLSNFQDTTIFPGHGDSAIIRDIKRKITLLLKIKGK